MVQNYHSQVHQFLMKNSKKTDCRRKEYYFFMNSKHGLKDLLEQKT